MSPGAGERLVRHVGDTLRFSLSASAEIRPENGWQARLRTTLGRARAHHSEIIGAHTTRVAPFGACWHDVPLDWDKTAWIREFVFTEVGFFSAKPYFIDPRGYQQWPDGPDAGISVHPDWCRSAQLVYCAFTRLFGETRFSRRLHPEPMEEVLAGLEKAGFAVLPSSGTFRDLIRQLPHIIRRVGCRILHLLPIAPTPTTYARFGRLGSPYAALDLTAIDPALVEFDRHTNAVGQFCELAQAVHELDGRLLIDIVINHTGWGSRLQEEHPEFFRREADGRFASPGAWGVVWEDLVELEPDRVELWDILADALLTWCRRGVDGFRCDAGYKIPVQVWQYIIARVRSQFPDTLFLLEGLGGPWKATEGLLTVGGMQAAYSELFQNYSGSEIQKYLDYALRQGDRVGTYIHYSETHDNERLAARSREWALLRNRLCALTSVRGGFGFTCGVEWLATEKIRVHERTGLAWDDPSNIVGELGTLNRLLAAHPAFFDGARLRRLSAAGSAIFALHRTGANGSHPLLVLVNSEEKLPGEFLLAPDATVTGPWTMDLLGQAVPKTRVGPAGTTFLLPPCSAYCLSPGPMPEVALGEAWRRNNSRIAWALQQAACVATPERLVGMPDRGLLAGVVDTDAPRWLATLSGLAGTDRASAMLDLRTALARWKEGGAFPNVVVWQPRDARRITLVPPGWWLVVRDSCGFRGALQGADGAPPEYVSSLPDSTGFIACYPPREPLRSYDARLSVERLSGEPRVVEAQVRFLAEHPSPPGPPDRDGVVLLTNGRGGMARLRADFGSVQSKYDCALGANLHPTLPVDRHVLVKRVRAWVNADGFLSALDRYNLDDLRHGPPAVWRFTANAGDSRTVHVILQAIMVPGRNTTLLRFSRPVSDTPVRMSLTLRADLEDRNYHSETRRNPGAEFHFSSHCQPLGDAVGFEFTPDPDRHLRAVADRGVFHPQPEWSERIPHPIEAARGQTPTGDAYSPGWFEFPLAPGEAAVLSLDADSPVLSASMTFPWLEQAALHATDSEASEATPSPEMLDRILVEATRAFVVRRGEGRTVIAGYPWFLDWGRDTLIAVRGLIAGGWHREALEILDVFGRFARDGTVPNSIFGDNASNRDTSDAPLWFAIAIEEAAAVEGESLLHAAVSPTGSTRLETVREIVEGYLRGTPNGIRVDPESSLVWSPSHFTWMDTNHPAGTPREGYPVEIQALWIRALRFLARMDGPRAASWSDLARRAEDSLQGLFWLEDRGWYSDVLLAPAGCPARQAIADTALRCNMLLVVTSGLMSVHRARRTVAAALEHLLVPGAVRTLAPLPANPPMPVRSADGRLLNDPSFPYRGRYEGDEDTRRKPAYHNGTAWVWFLPSLCEALVIAWDGHPGAVRAARALLGSVDELLHHGCLGQLPEILDGDAPHAQRGCDAQAWSVTECLRVWRRLNKPTD